MRTKEDGFIGTKNTDPTDSNQQYDINASMIISSSSHKTRKNEIII
jgi:hypothetical protein